MSKAKVVKFSKLDVAQKFCEKVNGELITCSPGEKAKYKVKVGKPEGKTISHRLRPRFFDDDEPYSYKKE